MRKWIVVLVALTLIAVPFAPALAEGEEVTDAAASQDVVDRAASEARLTRWGEVLEAAGWADTLRGAGPFTVFVPANSAFAKRGAPALDELTAAELKDLVQYHVVSGAYGAEDLADVTHLFTLQGDALDFAADEDGKLTVNGVALVTTADLETANGVIHVIDTVLAPPVAARKLVVTQETPVLAAPNGEDTGLVMEPCKTANVLARSGSFARIETMGGWISADGFVYVPMDYGIEGGTPVLPGCEVE